MCGDTVVASHTLSAADPVTSGNCPANGLDVNTSGVTLDCAGLPITGIGLMDGIHVTDPMGLGGTTVKNCHVSNFNNGILVDQNAGTVTVDNNTATGNANAGILIDTSFGANKVKNNNASSNSANAVGIWFKNSINDVVDNNTANWNGWGIAFETCTLETVERNTANGNANSGLDMYATTFSVVDDFNTFSSNLFGIRVWTGSTNNTIMRSTANLNNDGINIDPSSTGQTMDFNTVCNSTNTDIAAGSTGNQGTNNTCDNAFGWNDIGAAGCALSCAPAPPAPPANCSDGTPYGSCSGTLPRYCQNGTLVDSCSTCGCPAGQSCNSTAGSCYTPPAPPACQDGTLYSICSANKPLFCSNGTLVNTCTVCGCPAATTCNSGDGICYPACGDGTPYGQCSAAMPKLCSGGSLVDDCVTCGCPPGQGCDTGTKACFTPSAGCTAETQCPSGEYCKAGSCSPLEVTGADCMSDSQCQTGHCVGGACRDCESDGHCAEAEYCKENVCVPVDCPAGKITGHECVPYECMGSAECAENQVCREHKCVGLDCPEGQVIRDHACAMPEEPAQPGGFGMDTVLLVAAVAIVLLVLAGLALRKK
jgi:parallel beta-helix repeat protein